MKLINVTLMLLLFSAGLYANDDIANYFQLNSANVNEIYYSQSQEINSEFKYMVAYAVNTNKTWLDDRVGIFLVSRNDVRVLDLFPSERQKDFLPSIVKSTPEELIVSINSDYGDLKKIRYIIDLQSQDKLISRNELEPRGIPDDLH